MKRNPGLGLLLAGLLLVGAGGVQAGNPVVPLEGVQYRLDQGLKANLALFKGKLVQLTLKSGKTIAGRVKEVSDHFVHIEAVQSRDFFDALVVLGEIESVEAQFRAYQSDLDRLKK